jgi:hypothetical protein
MADVDAVDLAIAEKLEGLAGAMRKGEITGVYVVFATWGDEVGIIHTGEGAVELVEKSLELTCEWIAVGEVN